MAIQIRNDESVALNSADLQPRYESGFAWRTACSIYQALPGLRGFWPMSAFESGGNCFDQSGNGRTLTYNGNPAYDFDGLAPYIRFDGTGDYLSRASEAGLQIAGTETYVAAGHRGLICGGWFRPEDDTTNQSVIDKFYTVGQYGYTLALGGAVANDPPYFVISDDGTNFDSVISTVGYTTNTWYFVAARYNDADTGAELAVWLNNTQTTAATARNSIFAGTDNFGVGGKANGTTLYTGRASMVFLCATALADATVWAIYQHTRALFKV